MPKNWVENYFAHGRFPKVGQKQKTEMKRTIGYVRDKVNDLKPLLSTFKMARNFMS